jgi:signal transduction histidine kinase
MTPAAAGPARKQVANTPGAAVDIEYQQLGSDIFHDLSQPLSTLVCLLEVNLLIARSAKQMRHDLQIALKQARSIVQFDKALRELWSAGNAQQDQQQMSLGGCLREVVADLLPVAQSNQVKVVLTSDSDGLVNFQASRLRQALFHLLEFALASCAAGGQIQIKITADEDEEAVRVTVAISATAAPEVEESNAGAQARSGTAESAPSKQRGLKRRLGLVIARRIFETGDGSLHAQASGERLRLEVSLPFILQK